MSPDDTALQLLAELLAPDDAGMDSNCICLYCKAALLETLHQPTCPIVRARALLAATLHATTPEEAGQQAARAMAIVDRARKAFGGEQES